MGRAGLLKSRTGATVDRDVFSSKITETLESQANIEIRRQEVTELPEGDVILATGPLTSEAMSKVLQGLLGEEYLYFYDAIAPIVDAESLDMDILFAASRYGKGDGDEYLNSAMDKQQYQAFYEALIHAEPAPIHNFEKKLFFEGCLPIEELARRGVDTPRFGPMKPVGLERPDGTRPWAVMQLRQENLAKTHYNLVGFQSRLKWGDQKRVFSMLPGLENAEFVRLGQIHRNTFINSPVHLDTRYRLRKTPRVRLAGQITGVEGYLESAATGLAIALYLSAERRQKTVQDLPKKSALGALARHLTESTAKHFQPANINYGLFEPLEGRIPKKLRRGRMADRAHKALLQWMSSGEFEVEKALELPEDTVVPKNTGGEAPK